MGILIASTIIGLWAISWVYGLFGSLTPNLGMHVVWILWMSHLYTGLFITAHDAMHGAVSERWPTFNRWVGHLTLFLYAGFRLGPLLEAHRKHHNFPGTNKDPDYFLPGSANYLLWYLKFMREYITPTQILIMALLTQIAEHALAVPPWRIWTFWVLPSIISTLQLFTFGTYFPHRTSAKGFIDHHRARTSQLPVLWTFLSCYHFGIHHEHHLWPTTPWWRLPSRRRNSSS